MLAGIATIAAILALAAFSAVTALLTSLLFKLGNETGSDRSDALGSPDDLKLHAQPNSGEGQHGRS